MTAQQIAQDIDKKLGLYITNAFNRVEMVDLIKQYSEEEFESLQDLWDLSKKSERELIETIEGIRDYYVDLIPREFTTGDRFKRNDTEYILSQVGNSVVALIGLEDGNRWARPYEVNNILKITEEDLIHITSNQRQTFYQI